VPLHTFRSRARVLVALLAAACASLLAQERTVDQGVYTAAQAARGTKMFEGQCAKCHREAGVAPVLAGDRFTRSFGDATLDSLFTTIKTTMPRDAPGSLSDGDYVEIVAHLLRSNSYPDGMNELGVADLAGIKIPGQTGNLEFALVQVVGCLSQSGRNWTLAGATDPVRTRAPEPAKDDEAAQLDAMAAGTRTFRLQQVFGAPAGWTDQRVAAKGFLTKTATDERITVSSLRVLTAKCQLPQ
jgi:mono/diheme cytochrome c family protein